MRCKQLSMYMYVLYIFSWLLDQCPGCLIPTPVEKEKTENIETIQKEKYTKHKNAGDMPFLWIWTLMDKLAEIRIVEFDLWFIRSTA